VTPEALERAALDLATQTKDEWHELVEALVHAVDNVTIASSAVAAADGLVFRPSNDQKSQPDAGETAGIGTAHRITGMRNPPPQGRQSCR